MSKDCIKNDITTIISVVVIYFTASDYLFGIVNFLTFFSNFKLRNNYCRSPFITMTGGRHDNNMEF